MHDYTPSGPNEQNELVRNLVDMKLFRGMFCDLIKLCHVEEDHTIRAHYTFWYFVHLFLHSSSNWFVPWVQVVPSVRGHTTLASVHFMPRVASPHVSTDGSEAV